MAGVEPPAVSVRPKTASGQPPAASGRPASVSEQAPAIFRQRAAATEGWTLSPAQQPPIDALTLARGAVSIPDAFSTEVLTGRVYFMPAGQRQIKCFQASTAWFRLRKPFGQDACTNCADAPADQRSGSSSSLSSRMRRASQARWSSARSGSVMLTRSAGSKPAKGSSAATIVFVFSRNSKGEKYSR